MWMAVNRLVATAGEMGHPERHQQLIHQLSGRRGGGIDPVHVAVAPIVGVVIDVHHAARGGPRLGQEALRAIGIGAVREDGHVEDALDSGSTRYRSTPGRKSSTAGTGWGPP